MNRDQQFFHKLLDRATAFDYAPSEGQEMVWSACLALIHEAGDRAVRLGLTEIAARARKFKLIATPGEAQTLIGECLAALTPAPTAEEKNDLKTVKDASGVLRIGTGKVYDLVAKGLIKHVKVGRRICFRPADLDEYLNRSVQGAPGRLLRF
jgi:excisionase family DNA binding protein